VVAIAQSPHISNLQVIQLGHHAIMLWFCRGTVTSTFSKHADSKLQGWICRKEIQYEMARCFWNSSKCYRTFAVLTLLSCNFDPIVCPSKCYKFGNPNNDSSFNNKKNKSITTCASGALDVEPMVILSSVKIVEQVSYISVWLTNNIVNSPL